VANPKIEQRRLRYNDRDFHFVSYEGQPADERRNRPAVPPMWYLMNGGKRWPVIPHVRGEDVEKVDVALLRWVDRQIFHDGNGQK
jgi:hypothetical protein